jgi:hypothetical protein
MHELQMDGFQIETLRVNATPSPFVDLKDFDWHRQNIPRFEVVKHEDDFAWLDYDDYKEYQSS